MNGCEKLKNKERVWEEIDIDSLLHNFRATKKYLDDGCRIMAVVKADAYGLGAQTVAAELERAGADWFGVATSAEADQLRDNGIKIPILVLGIVPQGDVAGLVRRGVSLMGNSVRTAEM